MFRIASGPELMSRAMGFAEIEDEQIPRAPREHRERKVCTACCPLDYAVFESAKFLWTMANKIAGAHRICAGHVPNLPLQRRGPTGERVPHFVLAPERHLKCSCGACEQCLGHINQCDTVSLSLNGIPDGINR